MELKNFFARLLKKQPAAPAAEPRAPAPPAEKPENAESFLAGEIARAVGFEATGDITPREVTHDGQHSRIA